MKELEVKNMKPTDTLQSRIWTIFNSLRGENFKTEDYYVVLFLLSLYKDNLLPSEFSTDNSNINIRIKIETLLQKEKSHKSEQYLKIYKSIKPALKNLSQDAIKSIINILNSIDHKTLSKYFKEVFDVVLYRITQSQGRYVGGFVQPIEISRLICRLTQLPEHANVFNPFAGFASFAVNLDHGKNYYGQEVNEKTWAMGALRIMAHEMAETTNFVFDDSILNWPDQSRKFDLIVSNPPYGLRLRNQHKNIGYNIRNVEQFLIEKGLQSLTNEGKLIALLPQGFLFRSTRQEKQLRQILVDEDLLDTIISLPGGLQFNTGIPLIILIIDKKKTMPGKVRLIKAEKFVASKRHSEKILDDYALLKLIEGNSNDIDAIRIVNSQDIRETDYNLNVPRYFQKKLIPGSNEHLVKLKEVLEYVRPTKRGNVPEIGKLIRLKNLKDDKLDFQLDLSSIENIELKKTNVYQICESCLLLAQQGLTLKPTFFKYDGTPIYRNQSIFSFKLDESKADYSYIINELHADYVKDQLDSFRIGTTIPFIRKDDLLQIIIKLPSLKEQRAKVSGIQEANQAFRYFINKNLSNYWVDSNYYCESITKSHADSHYEKLLDRIYPIFGNILEKVKQNEFESLKHTLGRPRQNILDWADNLLDFISKHVNEFDTMNKSFEKFYEVDIISALMEIKTDVNFITEVLEKGEKGIKVTDYKKEIISLAEINNVLNEVAVRGFNFKLKKLLTKGEKLKERGFYANKTLFKILINDLLTNASKHGFDKKAEGNEVVIEFIEMEDMLNIEIRNNGKPFPKNFDKAKFITKYRTTGTGLSSGLGGFYIHQIASYFNNPDWVLSLNEDPLYPVKFKFQFPVKPI